MLLQSYLDSLVTKTKWRAILAFCVVHLGLALTVYGIASMDASAEGNPRMVALAGVGLLYGGMLLAVFFVAAPLIQLAKKIQRIMEWKSWILSELPQILSTLASLVPVIADAIRSFHSSSDAGKDDKDGNKTAESSTAATAPAATEKVPAI